MEHVDTSIGKPNGDGDRLTVIVFGERESHCEGAMIVLPDQLQLGWVAPNRTFFKRINEITHPQIDAVFVKVAKFRNRSVTAGAGKASKRAISAQCQMAVGDNVTATKPGTRFIF
ncbi:MAG: hypothetical protein R3E03_06395 [Novosphingobium sp.]